jgi:hypothetical protein
MRFGKKRSKEMVGNGGSVIVAIEGDRKINAGG